MNNNGSLQPSPSAQIKIPTTCEDVMKLAQQYWWGIIIVAILLWFLWNRNENKTKTKTVKHEDEE